MKYCNNCGKPMEDEAKFCQNCGTEFGIVINSVIPKDPFKDVTPKPESVEPNQTSTFTGGTPNFQNSTQYKPQHEYRRNDTFSTVGKVLLWIFFLPFMAIYTITKSRKMGTPIKVMLIIIISSFVFGSCIAGLPSGDATTTSSTTILQTTTKTTTTQTAKQTTTQTTAKPTTKATQKPATLTEAQYKAKCVDIPWAEIVKDTKTYVGTYIKKDLMVREIATITESGETVYICGENKGGGSYVGGTFTVFDRRSNKKHPIELYDKIYVYGQISGIYMTWSSYDPEYKVKYVTFKGKFGE